MVRGTPAEPAPAAQAAAAAATERDPAEGCPPGPAGLTGLEWEPVAGAPGLLRAETAKPDGRRLTIYRATGSGSP